MPALMSSCKYALTHKPMVGNVCYFICHDCQELVKRKFYFSQFILVATHISCVLLCRHGAASTHQGFKLMKIATDTHETPINIYANELYLISMFSYNLKDSERDIRMLKMIHGVAIKCWKFRNNCQRSWTVGHRLLNVPKIYKGSTTH